jgi:hypothetical protein
VPAAGGGEATPVEVAFSVDKANYKSGDIPVIKVTPSKDCRLSLFYEDASGKLTQLFPNQFIVNDQVKGGKEFQLLPALIRKSQETRSPSKSSALPSVKKASSSLPRRRHRAFWPLPIRKARAAVPFLTPSPKLPGWCLK